MSRALSMTQAAKEIGIDRATLRRLTDAGKFPYWFQTDSGRYIYSADVIAEHQRLAARRAL